MSFIRSMGMKMLQFMAGRGPMTAAAIVDLAMKFVARSQTAEAVAVLESFARLEPATYGDRAALARHLSGVVPKSEAASFLNYVMTLSWLLGLEGREDDSLALLEVSLGLEPPDYADTGRLMAILRGRLEDTPLPLASLLLMMLANLMANRGHFAEGLKILEADLGYAATPTELEFSTALTRRFVELAGDVAFLYASGLANLFSMAGREEEAGWVFKALIPTLQASSAEEFTSSLLDRLSSLNRNTAASFLFHFAEAIDSHEMRVTYLALLERFLDLERVDYRDLARLAVKLEAGLAGVLPGTASNYKLRLAQSLQQQGRETEAIALFRADTGLVEESASAAREAGAALRQRLATRIPDAMAVIYAGQFSAALIEADQAELGVPLLEGFMGLRESDYAEVRRLGEVLENLIESWGDMGTLLFLSFLLGGLEEEKDGGKSALLAEAFVDIFGSLASRPGADHFGLLPLMMIHGIWLKKFWQVAEKRPLERCRDLVLYLRRSFASHGVQLKDRASLIELTEELRGQILRTGQYWADFATDPDISSSIAVELQLWDAELTQRALVERFLLDPIRPAPPGPAPQPHWSWPGMAQPDSADPLPDLSLTRQAAGRLHESGKGRLAGSDGPSPPSRLEENRPDLLRIAGDAVAKGVDQARVSELLGPKGLLLRVGFDDEGRLYWVAFRAEDSRLRWVGKGKNAAGDLERVRWAAARHDFRMALAKFKVETRMPGTRHRVLNEVKQAIDELLFDLGPPMSLFFKVRLQWIRSRFCSPWEADTPRLVFPFLTVLETAPIFDAERNSWAKDAAAQLADLRARISEPISGRLQEELDRITGDYLQEVCGILRLDGLGPFLGPDIDLLVQLEDALHTIPIAHLPLCGQPLFRQVRSVRSSLSLLMSTLQQDAEKELVPGSQEQDYLLSISHFQADDRARQGGRWLEHGFSTLARLHGRPALAGGDLPPGSVGLLRTALDQLERIRVLAICGHGSLYDSGVALLQDDSNDEVLWKGSGCDLSSVDWLWMVSCSIGRLKQSGNLDVEGFCVQLALHRARSVAAFRWPVHCLEAVALVIESVRIYLESIPDGGWTMDPFLRARALNEARKSFFGDSVSPPRHSHVGLNTAAAAEIFGSG